MRGVKADSLPRHGPYGERVRDPRTGDDRLRLTPEGTALVEAYRQQWPNPAAVLWRAAPAAAAALTARDPHALDPGGEWAADAWLNVCVLACKYDPTRGVSFATYAVFALRTAAMYAGRHGATPAIGLDPELDADAGPSLRGRPREAAGEADARLDAPTLLRRVRCPKRRAALERHLGLDGRGGVTQAVIAEELGVSRARVHQLVQEAIADARGGGASDGG